MLRKTISIIISIVCAICIVITFKNSVDEPINLNSRLDIIKLSRKQAKLGITKEKHFIGLSLNKRIQLLLSKPKQYNNDDYRAGIVEQDENAAYDFCATPLNTLIISERYTSDIIRHITIGTSMAKVKKFLGAPSYVYDSSKICLVKNTFFYKYDKYCIMFSGNEKVKYAVVSRNIKTNYDKNILRDMLINAELYGTTEVSWGHEDFYHCGSTLHEGIGSIFTGTSYNGIEIQNGQQNYFENTINVYNNFEGNIYNYKGKKHFFKVKYTDTDIIFDKLCLALQIYIESNKKFNNSYNFNAPNRLEYSPNRKRAYVYQWESSQKQYIIVRAFDYSKPDYYIYTRMGDLKWLTDDYIIYIDYYAGIPAILKVDKPDRKPIYLFEQMAIKDVGETRTHDFLIQEIKNNQIILKDSMHNKIYRLNFSITGDKIIVNY